MKRKWFRLPASLPALVAAASLEAGCRPAQVVDGAGETPRSVQAARVVSGDVARRISLPGNVRAHQEVTLFARVGGYLKSIAVDRGDAVEEGQVIAEIEVPELLADLGRYRAGQVVQLSSQQQHQIIRADQSDELLLIIDYRQPPD